MPAALHHTGYESKEYRAWHGIKSRCYQPSTYAYKWYGARGIKICEKWKNDFLAFLSDVGCAPTPNHSIDRIDSNGNYEPGNCRWIPIKEQQKNQTSNVYLEYKGQKRIQSDWARILDCRYHSIWAHLQKGFPFKTFAERAEKRQLKKLEVFKV